MQMGDGSRHTIEENQRVPLEDEARVPIPESWDVDEDRFTFDDSDRFEDESMCSYSSEPESVYNNWRGWKRSEPKGTMYNASSKRTSEGKQLMH